MESINGVRVISSPLVREFVPKLQMRQCGCSQAVLDGMNDWLLERFGKRREAIVLNDNGRESIIVNPATYHWLRTNVALGRASYLAEVAL